MKFFPLVWRNLLRRKFRTFFTAAVDLLRVHAVRRADGDPAAFAMGVDMAGAGTADGDRQGVDHQPAARVVRGADQADRRRRPISTHANWFGGYYQDARNSSPTFAVDPESWLRIYPGVRRCPRIRRRRSSRTGPARSSAATPAKTIRLEGRRPRFRSRARSTAGRTAGRGSSRSTASTTRRSRAPTRRSSSSTTST